MKQISYGIALLISQIAFLSPTPAISKVPRSIAQGPTSSRIDQIDKLVNESSLLYNIALAKSAKDPIGKIAVRLKSAIERLSDSEQIGLLCVEAANRYRYASYFKSEKWDGLSLLLYSYGLEILSKRHDPKSKEALRHVAEALRGDYFDTHLLDLWVQSAMLQNSEDPFDTRRSGWYIETYLMEKYNATDSDQIRQLQERSKQYTDQGIKVPENIAAPLK